jgi:hypothetical protein
MHQEIFEHCFGNGQPVHYRRLASGTCYHADTSQRVIELLEALRQNGRKVRLYYGDVQTGQAWFEENDVIGVIGRSTGSIKVPLLVPIGDSGGPALLDQCIIRIDTPRKVLYQHEQFRVGEITLTSGNGKELPWEVCIDQVLHTRFQAKQHAQQYRDFIQGKRFELS